MANLKQKLLDGNVIINFISNRNDLLKEFQLQRESMRKMEEQQQENMQIRENIGKKIS